MVINRLSLIRLIFATNYKQMAILHKKEEKIQAVLGRLSKKYTHEQFVAMFIKLYSKDWGKIKSAYIKQSQDKEPGTVINMPKPDLYLKQILESYLKQNSITEPQEALVETVAVVKKAKAAAAKEETNAIEPKKTKAPTKKKTESVEEVKVQAERKATSKKKAIAEVSETIVKKVKVAKK